MSQSGSTMPSISANEALTSQSQPQSLTLPASIIATLSPNPYLLNHLQRKPPIRPSGRRPSTFQHPACTTSSLSHCFGSSVIRTGETAVACGIQGEILYSKDIADPPRRSQYSQQGQNQDETQIGAAGQNHDRQEREDFDDEALRHLNLLVPNIDFATGCSPSHLPGPPTHEAQTISHRLYTLLLSSRVVRLSDLRIPFTADSDQVSDDSNSLQDQAILGQGDEPAAYWTLYISLTVLSLAGTTSLFDSLWAATLAALTDMRLPRAWWDADLECVICSDTLSEANHLAIRGRPFVASWGIFEARREDGYIREKENDRVSEKNQPHLNVSTNNTYDNGKSGILDEGKSLPEGRRAWFLADPDAFEEPLCQETISIVVDCSSGDPQLLRIENLGGGVVGMDEMNRLVGAATERWDVWNSVLPPKVV